MTERKRLLLRLDPDVYERIARWAADDLRSVNAQIEYALRRALRAAGRAGPLSTDEPAVIEPAPNEPAPNEPSPNEPAPNEPAPDGPASDGRDDGAARGPEAGPA